MYCIIVYDVSVERVSKVCHFLRQYLNWIQNSVFEGELTESELARIEHKLKDLIDLNTDSVIIYKVSFKEIIQKKHIGIVKNEPSTII